MPFTAENLRKAIREGNVSLVRRIIQERPGGKEFSVDINNICPWNSGLKTAFSFTLNTSTISCETRFQILESILTARHPDGNPRLTEFSSYDTAERGAIEELIECEKFKTLSKAHVQTLIELLANLRFVSGQYRGQSAYNIDDSSRRLGALNEAILANNVEIVRMLTDLRDAHGNCQLNINYLKEITTERSSLRQWVTPLDFANLGLSSGSFTPKTEIITILRDAGGRLYSELSAREREQFATSAHGREEKHPARPRDAIYRYQEQKETTPIALRGPEEKQDEEKVFNDNEQNVHVPEVERSVNNAINLLKKRYNSPSSLDINLVLSEITGYLKQRSKMLKTSKVYTADDLTKIEKGFAFIQDTCVSKFIHPPSQLTMLQVLALVWTGANDENARTDEQAEMETAILIDTRKQALLDQLKEIQTAYPDKPSCIGGARNRLLKSLHKAYPGIFIAATREIAIEAARDFLYQLEKDHLLRKTPQEQRAILSSWNLLTEEKKEETAAYRFHHAIHTEMETEVRSKFGGIVEEQDLDYMVGLDFYDALPRPVVHLGLEIVINRIMGLYSGKASPEEKELIACIQSHAQHVFTLNQDYEKDYQYLHTFYRLYEDATKQLQGLDHLAKEEPPLPEVTSARSARISHIKKNIVTLYTEAKSPDDCKELPSQGEKNIRALKEMDATLRALLSFSDSIQGRARETVFLERMQKSYEEKDLEAEALVYVEVKAVLETLDGLEKNTVCKTCKTERLARVRLLKERAFDLCLIERGDFQANLAAIRKEILLFQTLDSQVKNLSTLPNQGHPENLKRALSGHPKKAYEMKELQDACEALEKIMKFWHKISNAYHAIQESKNHADLFNENIPDQKAAKETTQILNRNLSDQLARLLNNGDFQPETLRNFAEAANAEIEKARPILSQHRAEWKVILANLCLAFTLIGTFALLAKAIHSCYTEGRVILFFNETTSIKKLAVVEQRLARLCSPAKQ